MKKTVLVLLAAFALALGGAAPSDAFGGGGGHGGGHFGGGHFGGHSEGGVFGGGHFEGGHLGGGHFHEHGHFGVDFVFDPEFGPWWWDALPYGYPYPAAPLAVQSDPGVYLEQPPVRYWYYCGAPSGYYPYVKQCSTGWLRVAPAPAPTVPEE